MPAKFRLVRPGAAPAAAAPASAGPTMSLEKVAASNPLPVTPITCRGRVTWIFGVQTKYPQQKLVLTGKPVANPSGEPASVKLLVKCNSPSPVQLGVDQMVEIRNCECRPVWKNQSGQVAEGAVIDGLCTTVELAVNFPTNKRSVSAVRLG